MSLRAKSSAPADQQVPEAFWSLPSARLLAALRVDAMGLAPAEAALRLKRYGANALDAKKKATALGLFASQFKSPLVLILIFASVVSLIAAEWVDAAVVLVIVFGSTILGFVQEYIAGNAIEKLRSQVTITSSVLRGGATKTLPSAQVVPGDVLLLSAGSLIPADGVVLEAKDFFVNQAVLTGETFPVEKKPGAVAANAGLAERSNCVFMGTSARSGSARVLIVQTGKTSVIAFTIALPYLPFSALRGFVPLPAPLMLAMIGMTLAYVIAVEVAKHYFYSKLAHAKA